jgi:hypothetical protein
MQYRAGLGFRTRVKPDGTTVSALIAEPTEPHWWCSCGNWRFTAVAMPGRKTGNNRIEAERSFAKHREAAS